MQAGGGAGRLGTLDWRPATEHPDLLGGPVAAALAGWVRAREVLVAPIDADLADTAAFLEAYEVPARASANCVVVAGRRDGEQRVAAALVPSALRADVNGAVRRLLDVRKASFLAMPEAVERTGMAYGGITPLGLPPDWPVLVDAAVLEEPLVVVGSGVRTSKLALPGAAAADLPGARVVEGLAR